MNGLPQTRGDRTLTGNRRIARGETNGRRWSRREIEVECACGSRSWMRPTQWRNCMNDRCRACESKRRRITPAAAAERARSACQP